MYYKYVQIFVGTNTPQINVLMFFVVVVFLHEYSKTECSNMIVGMLEP